LNDNCWHYVLSFLSSRHLLALSMVSKRMRRLTEEPKLWKMLLNNELLFGGTIKCAEDLINPPWKEIFKGFVQFYYSATTRLALMKTRCPKCFLETLEIEVFLDEDEGSLILPATLARITNFTVPLSRKYEEKRVEDTAFILRCTRCKYSKILRNELCAYCEHKSASCFCGSCDRRVCSNCSNNVCYACARKSFCKDCSIICAKCTETYCDKCSGESLIDLGHGYDPSMQVEEVELCINCQSSFLVHDNFSDDSECGSEGDL